MSLIVFARHDDDMFYDSYGNTILYLIIPDRNVPIYISKLLCIEAWMGFWVHL